MIALLFRWLILMCLVLPGALWAVPVGALTDATGERVGMQDIPDWGDTPGKIHRRYCAERATLPAIWASTLTPNGIKSDRRMPAHELLAVHCTELRSAWKGWSVSVAVPSRELSEVKAELGQVNAELSAVKTELTGLRGEIEGLKGEVQAVPKAVLSMLPSGPLPTLWWQDYRFWIMVMLALLLAGVACVLALMFQMRRRQETVSLKRQDSLRGSGRVWSVPVNEQSTHLFVAVPDTMTHELRLFRFLTTKYPDRLYSHVSPEHVASIALLGREMHAILTRYVEESRNPEHYHEREQVDRARNNGSLIEIMPV